MVPLMLDLSIAPNPDDSELWKMGSDADWIRGSIVATDEHPGVLAQRHQWLVANRLFAESMIRANGELVTSIIGALLSWRVCTIDQLRAGLSVKGAPEFHRDEPNLYGALCRLGAIDIGFSPYERFSGMEVNQAWVSLSSDKKLIRKTLALYNSATWLRRMLADKQLIGMRRHVRHNTYAAHVGLSLAENKNIRIIGGDGWGAFRLIDPQAVGEAGLPHNCSTDLVALTSDSVLTGIEVQVHTNNMSQKISNWSKLLAYSPMSRRGLMCIWLLIKDTSQGRYPALTNIIETASHASEMLVGNPTVASRMGFALWEEWFTPDGKPTEQLGAYTDMLGNKQNMFAPYWKQFTPSTRPISAIRDWGWSVMTEAIKRNWGWDVNAWEKPEAYRGGFYGYIEGDSSELA